jgi:hypothetical protein
VKLADRCASVSSVLVFAQDLRDLLHLAGESRGLLAEHGRDRLAGIPGPLGDSHLLPFGVRRTPRQARLVLEDDFGPLRRPSPSLVEQRRRRLARIRCTESETPSGSRR